MLTPEMLSDRSSSDLISQQYNHPTNRTVRCPMRNHVPQKLHNCRLLSTGLAELTSKILPLFSPTGASLLVFRSRQFLTCDYKESLFGRIRHCGAANKTRTKIFVILAVSRLRCLIEGSPPACSTGHAFYHVTISGHA